MPFRDTRFLVLRRWCLALPLGLLLAGVAATAPQPPQDPGSSSDEGPGDPSGGRRGGFRDDDGAPAEPLPWHQLSPAQHTFLAPLKSQWDQLPPRRQQRMAAHAEHWSQLPPDRQAVIRQRMEHWARMTPQQRTDAAHNAHAFQNMSPADRQRVADVFQRFQSLTPEQKQALREKFRAMHAGHANDRGDARSGGPASPQGQP